MPSPIAHSGGLLPVDALEALLADDYELTLVWAPLVDTDECCRYEACESEEHCTCNPEGEGDMIDSLSPVSS